MSMGMPGMPTPNTFDCARNAQQIASLQNEEILLQAANQVAQLKLVKAQADHDTATHNAQIASMQLMANRSKQLELQGLANANGC